MSTFDDFLDRAKSFADTAGRKTSDFIDVTKLRFKIAEVEKDIVKIYEEIGRAVYESKKSGRDIDGRLADDFAALDESYEYRAFLKKQVDEFKDVLRCDVCGAANSEDSVFCKQCGKQLR